MPTAIDSDTLTATPKMKPQPRIQPQVRPKLQPPYAVILHNDDINGFDYVIRSLRRTFGFGLAKAFKLTLQAHFTGRSCVWSGMKEHAEFKADQLRSCGPDPAMVHKGAMPLSVSIEAQPV
ncbi:MAG: ATP-dependent Clp protease adaptor ClpS [Phycisphaerales bacterium]|nr:ATP-dependent Clp protease adaptor ClpS [Phycisphaerales bacterium]